MKKSYQIYLFSLTLILLAFGLMFYKVNYLSFPLTANDTQNIWNIQATVTFKGKDEKALIALTLPQKQDGLIILNEESSSANFGFTKRNVEGVRKAVWSKRDVKDEQTLYYSLDIIKDKFYKVNKDINQDFYIPELSKPAQIASKSLIDSIYDKSASSLTFASLLVKEFNKKSSSQVTKMLKNNFIKDNKSKRDLIVQLINSKGYKVRTIGALRLKDKKRNIDLDHMFEVFSKNKWYLYDLKKGLIDKKDNIFIWQRGSQFLLDAVGAKNSKVTFSISKNIVSARNAALSKDKKNQSSILDFSLFILPNSAQNTFKLLLLVPLGALVVVIMRVLVGLKTSGTFMPILLALAFIETQLLPGILMFILVVAIGLIVRSYLSHLNLLLVARISSVLIVVLAIMAFMAILSKKLDLEYSTSVTFFPIIILAWTIERMSIIWEEDGAKEVFQQGGGSLIVAVLAYFTMTNDNLSFITFNFPEVLLAVLGIIIILGRYSGYRLSELKRFKSMVD